MTLASGFAFFLFSFVAAVTPGPSNVLLAAAGAQAGIRRGLPCLFGVSAGMGSLMFLAACGLAGVLQILPVLLVAIRVAGSAFLLWLAWKIASAPVEQPGNADPQTGRVVGFTEAAALQWINPKGLVVSAGAVATYLPATDGNTAGLPLSAAMFACTFVLAALPAGTVWLVFGVAAGRLLDNARRRRLFNIAMGILLAGSVVMIVV